MSASISSTLSVIPLGRAACRRLVALVSIKPAIRETAAGCKTYSTEASTVEHGIDPPVGCFMNRTVLLY